MPIGSGIFTYIWLIFMANVGKYTIVPWILCDIDLWLAFRESIRVQLMNSSSRSAPTMILIHGVIEPLQATLSMGNWGCNPYRYYRWSYIPTHN